MINPFPVVQMVLEGGSRGREGGGAEAGEGGTSLGMFLLMPDSPSLAPLSGRKDRGRRSVRV